MREGGRELYLELVRETLAERLAGPGVVGEPQVAADHVLQKPLARLLAELDDHLAQDHGDVGEPVVGLTDVVQTSLVQQDLLQDEGRHRLAQLRAALHDPQAERDDLGGEQEVDHLLLVGLHEGPDDPEGGEAEVLEGAGLADGVEEGVEVEGDVSQEEGRPGVGVRGHALQQGQGVADSVALVGRQHRRVDCWVDVDNLLIKRWKYYDINC